MDWTRRRIAGAILSAAAIELCPRTGLADIPRVERIRRRVEPELFALFGQAGLSFPPKRLFLRAFKHEKILQMWGAEEPGDQMVLVETYPVCFASGVLGPKRRYGDEQVPEGVYEIHRYNGWSSYHMSMRVDYPNVSDRRRGNSRSLGGGIMIHGDCVSIGCIAIEDRPIERVFLSALAAQRAGGERVPTHIFPTRLDESGQDRLRPLAPAGSDRARLWAELTPIYAAFEESRRVPEVAIDPETGAYGLAESDSARG